MSAIELAVAWTLSIIVAIAPPGRKSYYPDAEETQQEAEVRLESVAKDVVEIVYDPDTAPLFEGPYGRARSVTLMLAIMTNESGFRKDVDFGLGKYARGDGGRSWCLMQLNIGKGSTLKWNYVQDRKPRWGDDPLEIFTGYFGEDLVTDRRRCISEGYKYMRLSLRGCKSNPLEHRLAAYVSGKCTDGFEGSADRFKTAARWFQARRGLMVFNEAEVLQDWPAWQRSRNALVVSTRTSTNELRDAHAKLRKEAQRLLSLRTLDPKRGPEVVASRETDSPAQN